MLTADVARSILGGEVGKPNEVNPYLCMIGQKGASSPAKENYSCTLTVTPYGSVSEAADRLAEIRRVAEGSDAVQDLDLGDSAFLLHLVGSDGVESASADVLTGSTIVALSCQTEVRDPDLAAGQLDLDAFVAALQPIVDQV